MLMTSKWFFLKFQFYLKDMVKEIKSNLIQFEEVTL